MVLPDDVSVWIQLRSLSTDHGQSSCCYHFLLTSLKCPHTGHHHESPTPETDANPIDPIVKCDEYSQLYWLIIFNKFNDRFIYIIQFVDLTCIKTTMQPSNMLAMAKWRRTLSAPAIVIFLFYKQKQNGLKLNGIFNSGRVQCVALTIIR